MKITFKKDYRTFKANTSITIPMLDYPTCIVGDNGSGKSSLLQAIRGKFETIGGIIDSRDWNAMNKSDYISQSKNIELEDCEFTQCFGFDAHKDVGNTIYTAYDATKFIASGGFHAHNKSHGESEFIYFNRFLDEITPKLKNGKTLIILDEFDKGFSIRNQSLAIKMLFAFMLKHNVFILFTTHNPFLIAESICFDLDGKNINPGDYIYEQTGFSLIRGKH